MRPEAAIPTASKFRGVNEHRRRHRWRHLLVSSAPPAPPRSQTPHRVDHQLISIANIRWRGTHVTATHAPFARRSDVATRRGRGCASSVDGCSRGSRMAHCRGSAGEVGAVSGAGSSRLSLSRMVMASAPVVMEAAAFRLVVGPRAHHLVFPSRHEKLPRHHGRDLVCSSLQPSLDFVVESRRRAHALRAVPRNRPTRRNVTERGEYRRLHHVAVDKAPGVSVTAVGS